MEGQTRACTQVIESDIVWTWQCSTGLISCACYHICVHRSRKKSLASCEYGVIFVDDVNNEVGRDAARLLPWTYDTDRNTCFRASLHQQMQHLTISICLLRQTSSIPAFCICSPITPRLGRRLYNVCVGLSCRGSRINPPIPQVVTTIETTFNLDDGRASAILSTLRTLALPLCRSEPHIQRQKINHSTRATVTEAVMWLVSAWPAHALRTFVLTCLTAIIALVIFITVRLPRRRRSRL